MLTLPPRNPLSGAGVFRLPTPVSRVAASASVSGSGVLREGWVTQGMSEASEPCAIPRCLHQAVTTLRLLVDGYDAVLPMCQSHADWLGAYVEEDANVRLVGRLPEAAQHPVAEDGANDRTDVSASGASAHKVRGGHLIGDQGGTDSTGGGQTSPTLEG